LYIITSIDIFVSGVLIIEEFGHIYSSDLLDIGVLAVVSLVSCELMD